MDHLKVTCPKCKTVLIVDRITGEILDVREELIAETERTGDRFQDALKKIKLDHDDAEEKFIKSREAEKNKHKTLDDLFNKSLDQVKKEGPVEKHIKNIDLE
jgi:septal ring factor EnvC (AmiA/AmiB activator)